VRPLKLSSVDLNLLVVFDTIMAERSVSRAAERLHLSQSAVSHALTRLRALLDDALFVRSPTGMQPTPYAESIATRIRTALDDIQDVLTPEDAFEPGRSTQRFTVAMTDYVALVVMPALARRIEATAPGVRIVVLPGSARTSAGMIEAGEADLYVGSALHDPQTFISSSNLYREQSVCVARRGHPAFSRRLTAERLLGCAHVHVSPWGEVGYIDEMLARQGSRRHIAMTVGHFLLVPSIVECTDLVAILPQRIAEPLARRYGLVFKPPPFDLGESQIDQIWHRRFDADAGLRWLRGEIAAVCTVTRRRRSATS
jgi:DNA-binding transcriptional LysR family regulator